MGRRSASFLIQGAYLMISPSTVKPDPKAAIIAFGQTSGSDAYQASWFKTEDIPAVKTAAAAMKFAVVELATEADRALAVGVHEGVLKGSGRMVLGSVTPEAYRRIEEHARKAAGGESNEAGGAAVKASGDGKASLGVSAAPSPSGIAPAAAEAKVASVPQGERVEPPSPTAPWDGLRVGAVVLAAYWEKNGEPGGWWPAVITRVEKNEFGLKWRDTPDIPLGKLPPKYIALLHPQFLLSRE